MVFFDKSGEGVLCRGEIPSPRHGPQRNMRYCGKSLTHKYSFILRMKSMVVKSNKYSKILTGHVIFL